MAKKALPEPNCHALEALSPFITPNALKLAADRLRMSDAKIALLIVKAINPYEVLTNQEEATLRGITRNTVSKLKAEKALPPVA